MIRKAILEDKEEIYKLGNIVNKNFSKVYDLDKMFNESFNKIYVAEDNNVIVGMLMVIVLYETCEILNIVVKDEYRNKKIASNLLDNLISELDESVEMITLEVAVNNEPAINLYKKFGFEIISTRKNYYDNVDAYLMGVKYERC